MDVLSFLDTASTFSPTLPVSNGANVDEESSVALDPLSFYIKMEASNSDSDSQYDEDDSLPVESDFLGFESDSVDALTVGPTTIPAMIAETATVSQETTVTSTVQQHPLKKLFECFADSVIAFPLDLQTKTKMEIMQLICAAEELAQQRNSE